MNPEEDKVVEDNGIKSSTENIKFKTSDNRKQQIHAGAISPGSTHLPLTDINNINAREYVSSIENAQKKWLENAKSWEVEDELQNAQLQWMKDFSLNKHSLCTSTPQPKKKTSYLLPFSPPKSSADTEPRRGVCVYKPGAKTERREFTNERGNIVKVASLPGPCRDILKKPITEDRQKIVKQKLFSLPEANVDNPQKQSRKQFITVRRKLERLKDVEPTEKDKKSKSLNVQEGISPDSKSNDRREAARQYIVRKRVEREREIEEKRRKEAKAEAEKRARMERLRETQKRLMKSIIRKVPEKNEEEVIDKSSQEKLNDSKDNNYSDAASQEYSVYSQRRRKRSSKSSSPRNKYGPGSPGSSQNYQPVQPPDTVDADNNDGGINLEPHLMDVFLDRDISPKKQLALFELLEEGSLENKLHTPTGLLNVLKSKTFASTVNRMPSPVPTSSMNEESSPKSSTATSLKSSATSLHALSSTSDYGKKAESGRSFSDHPCRLSSQEKVEVTEKLREDSRIFSKSSVTSDVIPFWQETQGVEQPYNILRAVANKHAAFEHYKDSMNEGRSRSDNQNYNLLNRKLANDIENLKLSNSKKRDYSEKGIQCSNIESDIRPTNYSFSSVPDSWGRNSGEDQLKKPNVGLLSGRASDPYTYGSSKPLDILQQGQKEKMHSSFLGNVDLPSYIPSNDNEIQSRQFYLKEQICPNVKGRPYNEMVGNVSCNIPLGSLKIVEDLGLLSKSLDPALNTEALLKDSKNENIVSNTSLSTGNVSAPSQLLFIEEPSVSVLKNIDSIPQRIAAAQNLKPNQLSYQGDRDSRIVEEIKKLEEFNLSISSVIEKNKTSLSHNDLNLKSSCDESLVLEKTRTSSTINNDIMNELSKITGLQGSYSSSSLDIPSEDLSGTSVAKFSLNMFNELLKDEDLRSIHQSTVFKMQENSITEKAKAEITYLELEKKKFKEKGNEEGVRNIRKKIRGIIIKLDHDLEELNRLKKIEKIEYRKRRQRLVDSIRTIKLQMKVQPDNQQRSANQAKSTSSVLEGKKSHLTPSSVEKRKKDLEQRDSLLKERLAELENISSWKHRLEEGEKRIQEIVAHLEKTTAQGTQNLEKKGCYVERSTSPFRHISDDNQGERQKAEGSYSDTFDQASSSSTHERLEEKDARKMMSIKIPLSPRISLKRRHSSGSDESLLLSQTETQSEASDMEVRVLALQQQLKQRKAKLESLHREYKKSQRERLIAKEQSLLSQIQAYDLYIEQVRKELEKGKNEENVKFVKPLIKQPKLVSDRRKSDTWLLQEKKDKCDKRLDSFLVSASREGSADSLQKSDTTKVEEDKANNYRLDVKSVEMLAIKSNLMLKNSFSEPNLLDEHLSGSRVTSRLSSDSCDSDMDKIKDSDVRSDAKVIISPSVFEGLPASASAESGSPKASTDRTPKFNRNNAIDVKECVEKNLLLPGRGDGETLTTSHDTDVELKDSDENSSSKESIISKVYDNSSDIKKSPSAVDIKDLSSINMLDKNSNENASLPQQVDNSTKSESSTLRETSKIKTQDSVDPAPTDSSGSLKSDHIENSHSEKSSNVRSVAEVISVENTLHSEIIAEEILDSINSQQTVSKSEVSKKVSTSENVVETTSENILEAIASESVKTPKDMPHENAFNIGLTTSKNDSSDEASEIIENPIEESVKEVTYLEVSDHVLSEISFEQQESENNKSESLKDKIVNEQIKSSDNSGTVSFETYEEDKNLLNENSNAQISEDFRDDVGKDTFHSASEVEEVLSKSISEDLLTASFPLPITKNIPEKLIATGRDLDTPSSPELKIAPLSVNEKDNESIVSEMMPVLELGSSREHSVIAEDLEDNATEVHLDVSDILKHSDDIPEEELSDKSITIEENSNVESVFTIKNEGEESTQNKDVSEALEGSEEISEIADEGNSFPGILHESDVKSPLEEIHSEDSLCEHSNYSIGHEQEENIYSNEGKYERVSSENKLLKQELYNLLQSSPVQLDPVLMQQINFKGPSNSETLNENDSSTTLDTVSRELTMSAIEEATNLVLSAYLKRNRPDYLTERPDVIMFAGKVGDNEWRSDKDVAADNTDEAELLRLQQLRIDKEIEELEEEEARRYYFLRAIPDKPPPPYTPRRSSLVASVVEAAGEIWSGCTTTPPSFMIGSHLREFIWDLASELVAKINPPSTPRRPPWFTCKRSRPKKPIRTKDDLLEEVEKEAKICLGVEKRNIRENLIIKWSRKRRDNVDEILVMESQEEEREWTDFTEEENIIKNNIADAIISESMNTATLAICEAFIRKFEQ